MFDMMPFGRNRMMDVYRPFRDFDELPHNFFGGNELGGF